jgi:hypothetical protein
LVPRVGRRQDSAPCTRGSACISLSGASTATGPDSELDRAAPPALVPPGASTARSLGVSCCPPGDVGTAGPFAAVTLESGYCLPPREGRGNGRPGGPACGFLEIAGERAPDWAGPRPRPASVGGAFADEQARFVRGCHRTMAGEHSFVSGLEGLAKERRPRCINGVEERVADD